MWNRIKGFKPTRETFSRQNLLRIIPIIGVLVCIVVAIWFFLHPTELETALNWVKGIGIWGNLIMMILFVLIAFPIATGYTILALSSGFIWGIYEGLVITFIGGCVVGSGLSYWFCGTLCRKWVLEKIANRPIAKNFIQAVRMNGFKLTLMMRFTPIPFGIQNALFSVSDITFGPYAAATWIGMLPEAIMWNYFGNAAKTLTDVILNNGSTSVVQKIVLGVQIGVVAIICIVIIFFVRRAVKRTLESNSQIVELKDLEVDEVPTSTSPPKLTKVSEEPLSYLGSFEISPPMESTKIESSPIVQTPSIEKSLSIDNNK